MAARTELARVRTRQYMLGDAPAALERMVAARGGSRALDHPPLRFAALSLMSDLQDSSGDAAAAETSIMAALEAASEARDDHAAATALVKLVALVGVGGRRFDEARITGRIAEAALTRIPDADETRAGLYSVLGLLARLEGRFADARTMHERALFLADSADDASIAQRAAERSNLAATLIMMGEHERARVLLEQALELLERELGPEHPIVGHVHMNLGLGRAREDDHAGARREYEQAIAIWERAYGPDHVLVADCLDNLSVSEQAEGSLAEALAHSERAIEIFTRTLGPDHSESADAILNFGGVLHRQGHLDRAAAEYERALAIHEKALGAEHPDLGYDLTSLGECRLDQGRPVEAVALLERALALREGSGGDPRLADETRVMLDRARAAVRPEGRSD